MEVVVGLVALYPPYRLGAETGETYLQNHQAQDNAQSI